MATILVAEDDQAIAHLVKRYLEQADHTVLLAYDGEQALRLAESSLPDLLILDIMMPKMDGIALCRAVRAHSSVPIIFLTARETEDDRLAGLEVGADDYITKPFSFREMVARVNALLRRVGLDRQEVQSLRVGSLVADLAPRRASVDGVPLDLAPKEFDLLVYLMRNEGRPVSREEALREVWGYDFAGDTRTVDVHVKRLRQKLEDAAHAAQYLQTVWGVGYLLRCDET
ncbi:MAG: response regulator transcription factor [Firmicutes bacterium]|nr:response regulator transcription factor [Bacillota bacterium]